MPSSDFNSDYLVAKVSVLTDNEKIGEFIEYVNEFPEGSARRLEMEAAFFSHLADYVAGLARELRESGEVTLYDNL